MSGDFFFSSDSSGSKLLNFICVSPRTVTSSSHCAELPAKKSSKSRRARKVKKSRKECAVQTDGNIYHSENKPVTWEVGVQTDVIVYWGICDRCQSLGVFHLPN